MAEILIKAEDFVHPDPEVDRRAAWKKGHPVVVKPDGHKWGREEGPPKFIIVKIPGVSPDQLQNYIQEWRDDIDLQILSSDKTTDTYQVKLFNRNVSTSGVGDVSRTRVEQALSEWNITVDSFITNGVIFTFNVYNVLTSPEFWERRVDNINFTELSYDSTTGVHRIQIDYSAANVEPQRAERIATRVGGIVVNNDTTNKIMVVDFDRTDATNRFKRWLKERIEDIQARRRFCVPANLIDQVVRQGGIITVTKTQFLNYLRDKLTE